MRVLERLHHRAVVVHHRVHDAVEQRRPGLPPAAGRGDRTARAGARSTRDSPSCTVTSQLGPMKKSTSRVANACLPLPHVDAVQHQIEVAGIGFGLRELEAAAARPRSTADAEWNTSARTAHLVAGRCRQVHPHGRTRRRVEPLRLDPLGALHGAVLAHEDGDQSRVLTCRRLLLRRAPPAPPPGGRSARGTASSSRSRGRSCGRTDRRRVAAVLAADAELEVRPRLRGPSRRRSSSAGRRRSDRSSRTGSS